ncbi:flavin reductase family protein [Isoptericola sp. G70]|uniref:flavin reductase family protein n=1 Tax=Isoptericola sp. G70 TaxID=3376633 RepID=UPI003A80ABC6
MRGEAPEGQADVLSEDFRSAFRGHPAGVAIVTGRDAAGPAGLTVSSVASVSLRPPALVFSVTDSRAAGRVLSGPSLTVNLLLARDVPLAREFAMPGGARFTADQPWEYADGGPPWLTTAAAALLCRPLAVSAVGASRVVVAEVVRRLASSEGNRLVYCDRTFHRLTPASVI